MTFDQATMGTVAGLVQATEDGVVRGDIRCLLPAEVPLQLETIARRIRFRRAQEHLKRRFTACFEHLFASLTGLPLHALWSEPVESRRGAQPQESFPACSEGSSDAGPAICEGCLRASDRLIEGGTMDGGHFVGPCGLWNVRLEVRAAGWPSPVTLVVQARVQSGDAGPGVGRAVSPAAFNNAVALVRLVQRDLERCFIEAATGGETSELRCGAGKTIPRTHDVPTVIAGNSSPSGAVPASSGGRRSRRVVDEMVAHIHHHFHRPMTLGTVADALTMNASYLCALFSREMGMTFHRYLVEVRMSRARELLRDPRRRICEVACAVGYASADQFRHAFRLHTGHSPSVWRSRNGRFPPAAG